MSRRHTEAYGLLTVFALFGIAGCDSSSPTAAAENTVPTILNDQKAVNPPFNAGNFVAVVDNPYLPLTRGTIYHYRSETPDGVETDDAAVTRDSKKILGVDITVVHDQVFLEGDLTEDTFDWFSQDADGNVWYFCEDSTRTARW